LDWMPIVDLLASWLPGISAGWDMPLNGKETCAVPHSAILETLIRLRHQVPFVLDKSQS
jgi:hypothetical protein